MTKMKLAVAAACAAATLFAGLPAVASAAYPVTYGAQAFARFALNEAAAPTTVVGANNGCTPSAEHPYPVVLVHGTAEDEGSNWVTLAPLLANNGYCVYAFNYGQTWLSFGNRIDGLGDIAVSAQQLSSFVNAVLQRTGATQVDLVGHSQGGMMPNYYLRFLGGASRVHTLIGLAPSNHGTTLSGLVTLLNKLPFASMIAPFAQAIGVPALTEQEINSPFQQKLFGGGDTVSGPRYVVIETTHDEIVTPYQNAFLNGPDVTNITIQDQCPADPTAHIGIVMDSPTAQNVLNQLSSTPDPAFHATCGNYGVGI